MSIQIFAAYSLIILSGAEALAHPEINPPAFPDGAFVRLKCQIRGRYRYLHAQEDGIRISLSCEMTSPQEVWAVHHLVRSDTTFLLLRGAAYGKYFAMRLDHTNEGSRFIQCNYDTHDQDNLLWRVTTLEGTDEIELNSIHGDTRLNLLWNVEIIPTSPGPPVVVSSPTPSLITLPPLHCTDLGGAEFLKPKFPICGALKHLRWMFLSLCQFFKNYQL